MTTPPVSDIDSGWHILQSGGDRKALEEALECFKAAKDVPKAEEYALELQEILGQAEQRH